MINRAVRLFVFLLIALTSTQIQAQCKAENNCFKEGEALSFDLYFKYGLLYTKAGNAQLKVSDVTYKGHDAYKLMMTANSVGAANTVYSLTDTLVSYTTKDLVPLAYTKDAHEKKDYRTERATYNYSGGKVKLRNTNKKNGKLRYDTTLVSTNCIYDFISIIYYARTFDYEKTKKGDHATVSFLSGRRLVNMTIEHQGYENVLANNGSKYNCVKLILSINEKAFEDKHEAMKVYITNDANHIPIRIESKLRIGMARAVLNSYKGQRN